MGLAVRDRVRVKASDPPYGVVRGELGIIQELRCGRVYPWEVKLDGGLNIFFREDELEKVESNE